MSTVLILVSCTAALGSEPACIERAFLMPGWAECIDALEHHSLRVPEAGPGSETTMVACAMGEPGVRRLADAG